jgi:pantoate--beta-alanine ligase
VERVATVDEVRAAVESARAAGRNIGFVPTMGALHEGHLSLIRLARRHSDFVVLSIFVNPTQFAPGEDLASYPRALEEDSRLARTAGANLIFAPSASEIYPEGFATTVRVERLSEPLCGRSRPGHFDGVALVVAKLLNIVRPDVSVFGQKDAQQAVLIRRLAADLNLPGRILIGPTVREQDGLAMSSRNRYLDAEERGAARSVSRGLFAARTAFERGERDPRRLVAFVRESMEAEPLVVPEYVDIRDLADLSPWTGGGRPALLAAAARVGRARLIDNVILGGDVTGDGLAVAPAGREGNG